MIKENDRCRFTSCARKALPYVVRTGGMRNSVAPSAAVAEINEVSEEVGARWWDYEKQFMFVCASGFNVTRLFSGLVYTWLYQ